MPDTETLTESAPCHLVTTYPAPETPPQERERERVRYKELYEEMSTQVESLEESHRQLAQELRAERERLASEKKLTRLQEDMIEVLKLLASWRGFQPQTVPPLDEAHPF